LTASSEAKIMVNDNSAAYALFGSLDSNLKYIEEKSATSIIARGDQIIVRGEQEAVRNTVALLNQLLEWSEKGNSVTTSERLSKKYSFSSFSDDGFHGLRLR
jgi:phosphate starvation-inducible PhoH-like protein